MIFTRGTTSLNLVAHSYARVGSGDEIVLTPAEHHST